MSIPGEIPLEPRFVVWPCDHCHQGIEFDAVQLAGRAVCPARCPYCGKETSLQEPMRPVRLVLDPASAPAEAASPAPGAPEAAGAPSPAPEIPAPEPARAANPPAAPAPPTLAPPPAATVSPAPRPKPRMVMLPPEPPRPPEVRAPVDVRWLTDLGVVYFRQHQFEEAYSCFRRAAEQGFATAQFCLAVCHFNGHGTPPDETAALPWLRKAAEQRDANAEFTLGMAYQLGRGVISDPELATEWLRQAAGHGHAEAILRVRELDQKNAAPVPRHQDAPRPPVDAPPLATPPASSKRALEKKVTKIGQDLQRAILGLFQKK